MRRNTRLAAALAAGLIAPITAFGAAGDLVPIHPVTGDVEVVGSAGGRSLIVIGFNDVDGGNDNVALTNSIIQLRFYRAAGVAGGTTFNIPMTDLTEITNADNAGAIDTGDVWQLDITDEIAFIGAGTHSIDVIFVDPDGTDDSLTVDNDGFPGLGDDSDANDTLFEVNREAPTLTGAFLDDPNTEGEFDTLFLVFNFGLLGPDGAIDNSLKFADNMGVDNPSDTDEADLNIADFEYSTDGGETWTNFTVDDLLSVEAVADGDTFLQLNLDDVNTAIVEGVMVRVDPAAGDVYDGSGNRADGEVEVTEFEDIAIESVEFIASIPAGGGAVMDAIKVRMTLPVSDAGDATFWDGLALDGGDATDITITGASIDPDDAQCILLDVDASGTDGVAADGLGSGDADGESFELAVDSDTGDAPDDLFGNEFEGEQTVDITDAIIPVSTSDPFTIDANGDGVIDAFGICFSEPLSMADLDEDGFSITRETSTIHPFSLFNENLNAGIMDPGATENEVEITATGDDDDEIAITGFGLSSEDDEDRLGINNCLIIMIDPDFDWDGDADTDYAPGTQDTGFASVAFTGAEAFINDASGNAADEDFDDTVDVDMAGPVLARVDFSTGDNVDGADQLPSEDDGQVGDSPFNNVAFLIFNEEIQDNGVDEDRFRFGTSADERFQDGDFVGITGDGDNIAVFEDSTGGGFMPGDTFTVASDNGLTDAEGNEYAGTSGTGASDLEVEDATAPYILLQSDINGNVIHSAFLGGVDDEGFATTVTLTFSRDILVGTEGEPEDWEIEGVGNPTSVELTGPNVITLTFPTDLVAADNEVQVTYLGGDIDDAAERISAADTGAAVSQVDDTVIARQVPEADVDGEFMAVMDIAGGISLDGFTDGEPTDPSPAGTKMFGSIAVPTAHSARFTMGGVAATISDSGSMEAITNVLLGIKTDLYLLFDGPFMWFDNYKDNEENVDGIIRITLSTTNLNNVTFTGMGSFLTGVSTPAATISGGSVVICWDVLRSDDGTAQDLYEDGYSFEGQPIVSSTVVTGDDGAYLLHMTAPISAFNGTLNAISWPVIIVVELPNGTRYAVSSLLNATDLLGPITFQALQRQSDPFNSDANLIFDIDLANVGQQMLYSGWNSLPFDRNSGWQRTANGILAPAGVSNILTGTTLANVTAFDQFVYFYDLNEDGVWTSADDFEARLDSIVVSARCLDFFTFVLNNNGVRTGNNINAFTGGYAAGVFNPFDDDFTIGVFQYGPEISASTVFSAMTGTGSFPDTVTTLGWAFVTAPTGGSPASFLTANGSDFLIIFNRTDHDEVDIRTFSGAGAGDADEITAGQALFLHK